MITDNTALYGNAREPEKNSLSFEEIEHHLRLQVENAYRNGFVDGFNTAKGEIAQGINGMEINPTDVKVHATLHYDPQLVAVVAVVPDVPQGLC